MSAGLAVGLAVGLGLLAGNCLGFDGGALRCTTGAAITERVVVDRVQGEKGSPAQAFSDYSVKLDGQAIKGFKHVVEVV